MIADFVALCTATCVAIDDLYQAYLAPRGIALNQDAGQPLLALI